MNILIRGGRILDVRIGLDLVGDLLIEDGIVKQIGERIQKIPQAKILDADGHVVCPGFIDIHCHLREPGDQDQETIASGTAAAAKGGFTTVCAMPNTYPPVDSVRMVNFVMRKAKYEGVVNVLPIACVTAGRNGKSLTDLYGLARAGAVGFSDDGSPVTDMDLMIQAISSGFLIINHSEDLEISGRGVMNDGQVSANLGLKGIPTLAEEAMVERDIALAKSIGGRLHLAHISTAGSVDLIRQAKKTGVQVTAEATPHHLTITEDWTKSSDAHEFPYDTNAKVNPPLRSPQDVDALVNGLQDGTIDCIATDHAPHTDAGKQCSFEEAAFGISGLETALGSLMSLVHQGKLSITTLIEKLTVGPSMVLNNPNICSGSLQVGYPADVTIFDPQAEWIVDPRSLVSKGKNTPLTGLMLKGKVVCTIVGGQMVYEGETASNG